ncbi:MAG TPA: helix-turn-helix transcriptional regulator [Desulfatiglandales bacterium]|nr:helix-turn-helix transcriptional regulator [Desulfatiglandales bacterium]
MKKSFDMPIQDLMQQVIEINGLLIDREIINIPDVNIPTICKLRKQYGIKRADSSLRRLERRYGPGFVMRFKSIIEDPSSSLADVGRHFGFSREYVRRIFKKIYRLPYTEIYKKKILLRRLKADSLKLSSGRLMYVKKVKDKITNMGLGPKILIEAKSYFLLTNNNLRVTVLHSSKLRQIGNKKYFYVNVINKQKQGCDFFILSYLNNGDRSCYIIPNECMPKRGALIMISSNNTNGKYSRFKDAWHLLVNI